jgi:predicted porin
MNIRNGLLASASALGLMLTSQGAGAFDMMEVGEWKVEFSGNVNGFLSDVSCESDPAGPVLSGLACGSLSGGDYDDNNVRTGLLPSWLGFHAERTEGEIKYGVTIGFQPGIDSGADLTGAPIDGGLGLNSTNFRQVFLEFSGTDWGGIKIGRDLGLFGSDAILSDMTLSGVGTVSDLTQGGGNTSLGRIGVGYLYADWKGQVQYSSPNWGGFSFNVAVVDPWGLVNLSGVSLDAGSFSQEGSTYGLEGKVAYAWEGDFSGKVWASFISQKLKSANPALNDEDALGFDVGAKVGFGGFELVGYYYTGEGIGSAGFLFDAVDAAGNTRDSDGMYAQATYKIPGPGTKIGVSWGESNLDRGSADPVTTSLFETNESIVFGIYHPLTSALQLVLEYTQTEASAHNGNEAEEKAIAVGAILSY